MKLLVFIIVAILAISCYFYGFGRGQASVEPVVEYIELPPNTVIVYEEIEVPVIEEVEVIKEVEVIREVEVTRFIDVVWKVAVPTGSGKTLVEFANVGILDVWLRNNDVSENEYIIGEYECEEFVKDLLDAAQLDGYKMYPLFVEDSEGRINHADVTVPVKAQNAYYKVNAQTDTISLIVYRD